MEHCLCGGEYLYSFFRSCLKDIQLLSVIGPIWITVLLLFITGIPTIESRYDKKYANSKKYQKYKKETSLLIPMPKKVGEGRKWKFDQARMHSCFLQITNLLRLLRAHFPL